MESWFHVVILQFWFYLYHNMEIKVTVGALGFILSIDLFGIYVLVLRHASFGRQKCLCLLSFTLKRIWNIPFTPSLKLKTMEGCWQGIRETKSGLWRHSLVRYQGVGDDQPSVGNFILVTGCPNVFSILHQIIPKLGNNIVIASSPSDIESFISSPD